MRAFKAAPFRGPPPWELRVAEVAQRRRAGPTPPLISRHFVWGLDEAENPAKTKGTISQSEMKRFAEWS
jgi:hypothetical protein